MTPKIVPKRDEIPIEIQKKPQRPKDIPIEKIIELRRKGLSLQDIADICKCTAQNIHVRLQGIEEFETFSRDKALYYEHLQHKILRTIDESDIKKSPFGTRITAAAILEDKIRLIRGQATERIDTFAVTASLDELEKRKVELLQRVVLSRKTQDVV